MKSEVSSARIFREEETKFIILKFNISHKEISIAPLITNRQAQLKRKQKGFSNDTWRTRALRITYFISKFLLLLRQNTENIKFKLIDSKMFSVIGDYCSDFAFYQNQGLIYSKPTAFEKLWYQLPKCLRINISKKGKNNAFIFMPDSISKMCWNTLILIIIVINIFYIPLQIAFNLEDNNQLSSLYMLIFEQIPTISFTIDILISLNTAFYKEGLIHTSRKKIIINYIFNDFLQDFIAVIPFYLSYLYKLPFIQFLLLIRITKVSKLVKNLEEVLNLRERYAALVDLLKLVYLMLFVSHYCACAYYYIGILEVRYGYNSWLIFYKLIYSDKLTQYINSVYWSTITILTVGYGDLTPITNGEKIFCILASLTTIGVYGYIISSIGQIFKEMSEKESLLKNHLSKINFYLKKNNLNKQLHLKVQRYFEHYFQKYQDQDESEGINLLGELNEELKQEVLVDIYRKVLIQSKFLAENISQECLHELCNIVKTQKYHTNEVIFNKGQLCSRLYFLKSGQIQIYYQRAQINNVKVIHTPLKNIKIPGHVLCEKQFILNQFCEYSAKAIKITDVSYIDYKDFMDTLKNHPQDYEKFCLMKDNLIFNKHYKKFTTVCEICGFLHSFSECPFPFFQVNKDKIISQENKPTLMKRNSFVERRHRSTFDVNDLQNIALMRIIDQNVVDINILNDQYLKTLGFTDLKQLQNSDYKRVQSEIESSGKMLTIKEEEIENNYLINEYESQEDNISKIFSERNSSLENPINGFQQNNSRNFFIYQSEPDSLTRNRSPLQLSIPIKSPLKSQLKVELSESNSSESDSQIEPSCNSSMISLQNQKNNKVKSFKNLEPHLSRKHKKIHISAQNFKYLNSVGDKSLKSKIPTIFDSQKETASLNQELKIDEKTMVERRGRQRQSIAIITKLLVKANKIKSRVKRNDFNRIIQEKRQQIILTARKQQQLQSSRNLMRLLDDHENYQQNSPLQKQLMLDPFNNDESIRSPIIQNTHLDSCLSLKLEQQLDQKKTLQRVQEPQRLSQIQANSYQSDGLISKERNTELNLVIQYDIQIDRFTNFRYFFPNFNFNVVSNRINNTSLTILNKLNQSRQFKLQKKMQGRLNKKKFSEIRNSNIYSSRRSSVIQIEDNN